MKYKKIKIIYLLYRGSCWKPYYSVLDEQERKILRIEGPCCIADGVCCPCDQEFTLSLHDDERHIGKISKQYAGFAREAFTMADRFAITCNLIRSKPALIVLSRVYLFQFLQIYQLKLKQL